MPKIESRPLPVDQNLYLAIYSPYPMNLDIDSEQDVQSFFRWISACLGTPDFLVAMHYKRSEPAQILELVRPETDAVRLEDKLLGEHKWSKILVKPQSYEKEGSSRVFLSKVQNGHELRKSSWRRIDILEKWLDDWDPSTLFTEPYPRPTYCQAPPRSDMLIKPLSFKRFGLAPSPATPRQIPGLNVRTSSQKSPPEREVAPASRTGWDQPVNTTQARTPPVVQPRPTSAAYNPTPAQAVGVTVSASTNAWSRVPLPKAVDRQVSAPSAPQAKQTTKSLWSAGPPSASLPRSVPARNIPVNIRLPQNRRGAPFTQPLRGGRIASLGQPAIPSLRGEDSSDEESLDFYTADIPAPATTPSAPPPPDEPKQDDHGSAPLRMQGRWADIELHPKDDPLPPPICTLHQVICKKAICATYSAQIKTWERTRRERGLVASVLLKPGPANIPRAEALEKQANASKTPDAEGKKKRKKKKGAKGKGSQASSSVVSDTEQQDALDSSVQSDAESSMQRSTSGPPDGVGAGSSSGPSKQATTFSWAEEVDEEYEKKGRVIEEEEEEENPW
ncbi:hypothetical protein CYLTODRAFT_420751 [Cylindrobasidium torrendii FP15055 ss-10]|uniref:Uncharacterized protein n=1 Tax=Cylindrobasidium torrendii FP15055 ss-10 TaxID=1314674 RepID=A0A0D7BFN1_9AGAR|nr:hypothetical protein CYLTODRAFT_420751 [Cylindrobasidium torrendii FP15055 ss-10]